jgi:hypothetical protein
MQVRADLASPTRTDHEVAVGTARTRDRPAPRWPPACGRPVDRGVDRAQYLLVPRRNTALREALELLPEGLAGQSWVCTSQQALALGIPRDAIRRLVDGGQWTRLHRGVYLTAPGSDGLLTRMWAAHLALGPRSVLAGRTAGRYWGLLDDAGTSGEPICALLPDGSNRRASGVHVRRVPGPEARAHPTRLPPVMAVEHAVLDLFGSAPHLAAAVEVLMRACRLRLTTPQRIVAAADTWPRLRRRSLLLSVCSDVDSGITSPLERAYMTKVVGPHGLPPGRRQSPGIGHGGRRVYRDVLLEPWGVIVELDGRRGHEDEHSVLRDHLRDNVATLSGLPTLRFGWQGVVGRPCEVAGQVGTLLQARGWPGAPRPCGPGCRLGATTARAAGRGL